MVVTLNSDSSIRDCLLRIIEEQYILTDHEELARYGKDHSICPARPYDIVVKPGSPEEIAAILEVCRRFKVPVTPRGGGTGVTGGAIPAQGGIVLSLERLNKIITINKLDRFVIAESGVITADLCHLVEQTGLYFPVIPTSFQHSFIGGNIAENAGSIHSCKYGTMDKYVLNLEVVLPDGTIFWTGANVGKNATGLNLTQLFVGSEGILGIVTKVVLRLLKKPAYEGLLLAGFENLSSACKAVNAIKQSHLNPSGVELICQNALGITTTSFTERFPLVKKNIQAHLLVQLDNHSKAGLNNAMQEIVPILKHYSSEEPLKGNTPAQKDRLSRLRHCIGVALKNTPFGYRDIDICLPVSHLYEYIVEVEAICTNYDIPLVCFGHALDGNLHAMLLAREAITADETSPFNKAAHDIYRYALKKGGVISGEHGIGLLQKEFMQYQFTPAHLTLMQHIKQLFDPNGILNPGKIW